MEAHNFDIVIIGAGPAGASAAIFMAKKELSVALIDRAVFPRDKICGDQIILNVLDLFISSGIDLKPLIDFSLLPDMFQYITDSKKLSFDLRQLPIKSISCKRKIFDDFLFKEASKLAKSIYENSSNLTITKIDNHYLTSFTQNGIYTSIKSTYVVGADGASSFVKRRFFKELKYENAIATRSYVKYKGKELNINFYYDKKIQFGGYFWIFPISKVEANCGVILFTDDWKNHFKDLREVHFYFAKKHNNLISEPIEMDTWQTPFMLSNQPLINEKVLLVGDAAGLVNPMFGHGIDAAILSSYIATNHIVKNISSDNYDLDNYSSEIFNLFISKYINHKKFRNESMKVDEEFEKRLSTYFENIDNITLS